ncbi:helix-turn-helix transcriptional regulator [Solilutibacter silvestris]|uniref:helix-turn-helix transcriptional regulator n=1 Tax=Solilutibacter silvestris TaxID=1645665 RepID=UPI003D326E10
MPAATSLPATTSPERSSELGQFLRTRRETLAAAAMGLARSGRVRTPGLRREEVAQLAGIGVTWYTKLEQGRDVRPSRQTMEAIANALQCNDDELQYLLTLAGLENETRLPAPPDALCPFPQGHSILLEKLLPYPALLQNNALDLMACNVAYERLMGFSFDELSDLQRNCLYLSLFDPRWQRRLRLEPQAIPRMVAMFRAASTQHGGDHAWSSRLEYFLQHSSAFRDAWERYQVRSPENHEKTFDHPSFGKIRVRQTNWWSAPRNGTRLVVYLPVDASATIALEQLAAPGSAN